MRIYADDHSKIIEVRCNCCGKIIEKIGETELHVDYLHVEKKWSYFSSKDLERHSFDLCESCYDKWEKSFVIPTKKMPEIEVFEAIEDEFDLNDDNQENANQKQ